MSNSIAKEIARELRSGNSPTPRQVLKALRKAEKYVSRAVEVLADFTIMDDTPWREASHCASYLQTRIAEQEDKIELGIK